jgi:hydrogenase expression/formation protein HypC
MCLAVPSKIVTVDNLLAVVEVFGARKEVSLILLPEDAQVGEYVLVHAGFALQKIDESAAQASLSLIKEVADLLEQEEEGMVTGKGGP